VSESRRRREGLQQRDDASGEDALVTFDFAAAGARMHVSRNDRMKMEQEAGASADIAACAGKRAVELMVAFEFDAGVDLHDGDVWADWTPLVELGAPPQARVTMKMVEWLNKRLDGRVPLAAANLRRELRAYVREILFGGAR